MKLQWYVLHSKPNKEMSLWREIVMRGFECFYPRLHVCPVDPRSRKIRPYFPSYLFLHMDIELVGVSTFRWMPFLSELISFGGVPAIVPDDVIDTIRKNVDKINAVHGDDVVGLKRGNVIIIRGGLFDGYEAIFDTCLTGTERVRVLLKLLQARQINLELPSTQIQRKITLIDDPGNITD